MERGGMLLHDAVGTNCENDATTENQGSGVKYMVLRGVLDDCVCFIRLDMTTPPWCREKVMLYYYYSFFYVSPLTRYYLAGIGTETYHCSVKVPLRKDH